MPVTDVFEIPLHISLKSGFLHSCVSGLHNGVISYMLVLAVLLLIHVPTEIDQTHYCFQ